MYNHDIESYVITIRRKGTTQVMNVPDTESLKPAGATFKIEKPVKEKQTASVPDTIAVEASSSDSAKGVRSPLPGVIIDVKVNIGDKVKEGDVVAVLEAMKMENEIQSEYSGTVTSLNVSQGDSVLEGAVLITID